MSSIYIKFVNALLNKSKDYNNNNLIKNINKKVKVKETFFGNNKKIYYSTYRRQNY